MACRYKANREYSEHIYLLCPFGLLPLPSPRPPPSSTLASNFHTGISAFSDLCLLSIPQTDLCCTYRCVSYDGNHVFISVYTWLNFPPWFFCSPISQIFVSSSWILFNNTVHSSLSPWYFDYLMKKLLQLFINRNMDYLLTSFPLRVLTNVPYGKLLAEFSKTCFRQWIHH